MKPSTRPQLESNSSIRIFAILFLILLVVGRLGRIITPRPASHTTFVDPTAQFSNHSLAASSPATFSRTTTTVSAPQVTSSAHLRKSAASLKPSTQSTPRRDIAALYRGRGKLPRPEPTAEIEIEVLTLTDFDGLDEIVTDSYWGLNGRVEADFTHYTTAVNWFYQNQSSTEQAAELLDTRLTEGYEMGFTSPDAAEPTHLAPAL